MRIVNMSVSLVLLHRCLLYRLLLTFIAVFIVVSLIVVFFMVVFIAEPQAQRDEPAKLSSQRTNVMR